MNKTSKSGSSPFHILTALSLASLVTACQADNDEEFVSDELASAEDFADELAADTRYVHEFYKDQVGTKIALDLSDDHQYRFLTNRLRRAGLTSVTPMPSPSSPASSATPRWPRARRRRSPRA